ncbi:MAG: flippase-like domain-containing protein [Armatimonadetes bacterium]|nr:flippase-like domain-containing protein [Anaerolineae bacterium]
MTRNQQLGVAAGLLISAFFLWQAFNGLNPAAVWQEVQQAQFGWLLVGVGIFYVSMVVIAWRWGFLLNAVKRIPLRDLTELVAIGYMGNNVYPFRAGEVLRVALLYRWHRVPVARTTLAIIVERVLDGVVMLTFIIVPLRFIDIASPELRTAVAFATPIFIVAVAVFFVLAAAPNALRRILTLVTGLLPGKVGELVGKLGEDIIQGLESLRSPRDLAGTVFASFLSWLINAGVYWVVGFAFGLNVSFPVMLTVCGVVNLAGLIPASPGQFGIFEFFTIAVLVVVLGEGSRQQVTAYALVNHVVIWLPPTVLGFVLLARRGLGVSAITQAGQQPAEPPPA